MHILAFNDDIGGLMLACIFILINNIFRLVDIIAKLSLQKTSVLRHVSSVLQPILEKGIVDHSIIHRVLMEYFSIVDQVFQIPLVSLY